MRGIFLCLALLSAALMANPARAQTVPICSKEDIATSREVSQEVLEAHAGQKFGRLTIAPGRLRVYGLGISVVIDETGRMTCMTVRDAVPFRAPQFQRTPERDAFLANLSAITFSPLLENGTAIAFGGHIFVDEEERPLYDVIAPHGNLSSARIEIERHDHHNDPFVLRVDGTGAVSYAPNGGHGFGDIIGSQHYRVSPAQVAAIIGSAERSGFWSWRDMYWPDYGNDFQPDQDGHSAFYDRISITFGGRTKSVRAYRDGGAPFAFANIFDDFASRTKADIWWTIDAPMIVQLIENGFAFSSRKGGALLIRATSMREVPQDVIDRLITLDTPQSVVLTSAMFDTSLLDAAITGRRNAMIDRLLAEGILRKNGKTDRDAATRALMGAVETLSPDTVAKILPYSPGLSIRPNRGYPTRNGKAIPIITLAAHGFLRDSDIRLADQISVVQQLLDAGADINSRDDEGHSLLDKVINEGDRPFAEWLTAHGAVRTD